MCRAMVRRGLRGRPVPMTIDFQTELQASVDLTMSRRAVLLKAALLDATLEAENADRRED